MALEGKARRLAILELNVAFIISSGAALFAKIIPASAALITLGRCVVASIILWIFIRFHGALPKLETRKVRWSILITGVCLLGHWVTYYKAIQVSSVTVGMVAVYTYPLIASLLEPFWEKTRWDKSQLTLGFIGLIGVGFLAPEWKLENTSFQGVLWGIISATIYTIRNLTMKRYLSNVSAAGVLFYQLSISSILLLPWVTLEGQVHLRLQDWWALLALGALFTPFHHSLFARGFQRFPISVMSLMSTVQPVYGAMLAILLLGETLHWRTIVGGSMILFVAAAASIQRGQKVAEKMDENSPAK